MSQSERETAVSVVVPCRNEAAYIDRFLRSVLAQDLDGIDLEVIVADGRSTDGTRERLALIAAGDARLQVIDNPAGIVSTGLNAAIRAARGPVVIRMDVHTEYAPDYIRQCLAALDSTGADNVGGCPRVKMDSLRMKVLGAAYHSRFAAGGAKCHDAAYEGYTDTVFYGCWRKQTLERLGLFDESLVRNQDDELNLRLVRSGGRIWQSARILCWYRPRARVRDLFRQYFQYGFWKVAVIRKHGAPASWRHLVPGAFVAANLALLLAAAAGRMTGWETVFAYAGRLWLAMIVLYAAACAAAALSAVRRCGWLAALLLPPLFPVYHSAYGIGFLYGLAHWARNRSGGPAPPSCIGLTR